MADRERVDVPDWRYSCTDCGACCRWFVPLRAGEAERLTRLAWPPGEAVGGEIVVRLGGAPFLAQRDGSCVFYDAAARQCRVHRRFGQAAKPLACRSYPYNLAGTFPSRFSVVPRFDCPAVRQCQGAPLRDDLRQIQACLDEAGLAGGLGERELDGLREDRARRLVQALCAAWLEAPGLDIQSRMQGLVMTVNRLEVLGPVFLNDVDLAAILPTFLQRVRSDMQGRRARRLGQVERWRFLCLLLAHLRLDEELVGQGPRARWRRLLAFARVWSGRLSLRELGSWHPARPLAAAELFRSPLVEPERLDWQLFRDMLRLRLQGFQFLGASYYGLGFFAGLRGLATAYPMVLAAAKWSALARDPRHCRLEAADLDYAVGAIDHSLGRLSLTGLGLFTVLSRQITDPDAYRNLAQALAG